MIKSLWRTSHFLLAIFSSVFLLMASITGGILAFEPILNKTESYHISHTDTVYISEFIQNLQQNKTTFSSIKNNNGHLIIDFEDGKCYVNSKGKRLQKTQKKNKFFRFLTKLHRSLFLKSMGRIIVGIVSFFLFLIATTGMLLLLKRQFGFQVFFSKIVNENSEQYYHTILGRLFIIPILVIALSGTYLSLQRFKIIPKEKIKLKAKQLSKVKFKKPSDFEVFKSYTLADLSELKFPFSKDKDEYFHLKLKDKELLINQFSGEIVDKQIYSLSKQIGYLSFELHTGYFGIIWAMVILISSFSLVYFMYSGFIMSYRRLKNKIRNKYKFTECEYIILFGTENGSTKSFAKMLYEGFLKSGKKVFVTSLNKYQEFPKMKNLIVLTATYGDGDAPTNATKFLELLKKDINQHKYHFSVVGFGSMVYPKFCKFAIEVNEGLLSKKMATKILDLQTINNKSFEQFKHWMQLWNSEHKLDIKLDKSIIDKRKKHITFKVIGREKGEDTFMLDIVPLPHKKIAFVSGDLLGIYPNLETHERLYSIAKLNNQIRLSIKLHNNGLCSNYLYDIEIGGFIDGFIQQNKSFHFPNKAKKVIMIATGTGIAPFLGMLNSPKHIPIDLYFGIKNKKSLSLYENLIYSSLENNNLSNFYLAYSRETDEKIYVQELIEQDSSKIIFDLKNGAVIMICGSILMQNAVLKVLQNVLQSEGKSLSYYKNRGQILLDCY